MSKAHDESVATVVSAIREFRDTKAPEAFTFIAEDIERGDFTSAASMIVQLKERLDILGHMIAVTYISSVVEKSKTAPLN